MARISVLGGTGYAGGSIVSEAARRGHKVTSISRALPESPIPGVTYVVANVQNETTLDTALEGADIAVFALAPRGDLMDAMEDISNAFIAKAKAKGSRIAYVGGAGSLLKTEGGPRVIDAPDFNSDYLHEATVHVNILGTLLKTSDLHWFTLSPAAVFGAYARGEATGKFRLGTDVLVVGEDGASYISGPDYATAFVDEIEKPTHTGKRFTVGY